jgi:parvulin-like peptidyl-prolyl isomerase
LDSEDKIKEAALRINKKEDFSRIAKEMGSNIKETGLFTQTDPIPGIGWSPEILNLISRLKVNQFSGPIHMDKNYCILRLKERKEAYIPDFEKIKDKVRQTFVKDKSTKLAKDKIEEVLKKLKGLYESNPKLIDFEKQAKEYGLKSDSTAPFKTGSYIEGIGASDNFWEAALELKNGEFSDIVSVPSGFYIIKLKNRTAVDEKKFESEKPEFQKRLLLQKKEEYFTKFVEELSRISGIPQ